MSDVPEAACAKTRPYFPELDGVRAIAALMIMVFHYGQDWYSFGLLIFGQTGVDLFFVLSGFLITTILLQAAPGDWHEIRNFYIRRTLRIFPLYYLYLVLACVVGGAVSVWYWFYLQNVAEALRVPLQLAELHGPGHFWSLGVEEQFYLVWPFVILFWPRRWLAYVLWGTVALAMVSRLLLVHTTVSTFPFTLTRLDGLAGGALLAYYLWRGTLGRARTLLIAMLPVALLSLMLEKMASRGTGLAWVEVVKYSSATALYASVVGWLVITDDSVAHRLLRSKPMREVGRVSYGLYVYHPVIFATLPPRLGGMPLLAKAAISFAVAYGVSVVSYYGFEKRFVDMKGRLAPERPFRAVTASIARND